MGAGRIEDTWQEWPEEKWKPMSILRWREDELIRITFKNFEVSNYARIYNKKIKHFLNGGSDKDGYITVSIKTNKKKYTLKLARLVATAFIPNPDELPTIDHKDGDRTNNYFENLRWSTHQQQMRNRKKYNLKKKGKSYSKYKGVMKSGKKWLARIRDNNEDIYLGTFNTENDAARAYNAEAIKRFGEFALINVIPNEQERLKWKRINMAKKDKPIKDKFKEGYCFVD